MIRNLAIKLKKFIIHLHKIVGMLVNFLDIFLSRNVMVRKFSLAVDFIRLRINVAFSSRLLTQSQYLNI